MTVATDFIVGLREAFTLREAERAALADGDARRAEAKRLASAARARRAAARKLASPIAAATLLREALVILGFEASGETHPAVRQFLATSSPLYVDELPFAEAEALRDALDTELGRRLGATDTRSVAAIRALRAGRLAAVGLAVFFLTLAFVRAKFLPHDVAIGKPVLTSGARDNGEAVVDGRTRGTFGVYTNEAARPFVMVDLEKPYTITRIRVFNRGDGWFDESLPLVIEISDEAVAFKQVAQRSTHFDVWTVDLPPGTRARFVRVAKPTRGYIALNEIEVYSRE